MATTPFSYAARSFTDVQQTSLDFLRTNYPDVAGEFTDGVGVGRVLIGLNAAAVDTLNYHLDRMVQETQLHYAQQRRSLLEMAYTQGLRLPGRRAAVAVVDFTVDVPPFGDSYDTRYLPRILAGSRVSGGGQEYETIADIDFSSDYSSNGDLNRRFIPREDAAGRIVSYAITKREVVYNGVTRVYSAPVPAGNNPFARLVLPEDQVLNIVAVIAKPTSAGAPIDADWTNDLYRFHEVEYLAETQRFVESPALGGGGAEKSGQWVPVRKKFIRETTEHGYTRLTFGGGNGDLDVLGAMNLGEDMPIRTLTQYLSPGALGEVLPNGSTVYVRYRRGGGANSNVAANSLTAIGAAEVVFPPTFGAFNTAVAAAVEGSLRVNNPIPALGGRDEPTIEEIRNLIAYHKAEKYACITLRDYLTRVQLMPGQYGAPYRVTAYKQRNQIVLAILGLSPLGRLDNQSTSLLKSNIAEYLTRYRAINDYVEVRDGQIFHLTYDITVLGEDGPAAGQITRDVVLAVAEFHRLADWQMNKAVLIGRLIEKINNVAGVVNVTGLRAFNPVGGEYSLNACPALLLDSTTREINLSNYHIPSTVDGMFELRDAARDVRVSVQRIAA